MAVMAVRAVTKASFWCKLMINWEA
jgi:hypothetical protein